jgi:P4 family phage/plasmid primase-like protien
VSQFATLFAAGFAELVCVIPPNAAMSAASKIPPDQRGKAPGRPNQGGQWGGYDWVAYEPTARDCATWDRARGNVGLKAERYPAVDLDVTDPALATALTELTLARLGPAPLRIGRAPKALLIYRTDAPFGRRRLRFTAPDGVEHLVEVLGRGQQYVVAGIHPATGQPYATEPALSAPADLTPITVESVDAFLAAAAELLTGLGCTVATSHSEGATPEQRAAIDQDALRAPSLSQLAGLVARIPNTEALFPGRDHYVSMGYAIKAAGAEDPGAAFDVFHEWASRWDGATDEAIVVDWDKMKPPFSIGWDYLLQIAAKTGQAQAAAQEEFEADDEPPAQAPQSAQEAPAAPEPVAMVLPWSDVAVANACVRAFGPEVRYVKHVGWLSWEGTRWAHDDAGHIQNRIARVAAAVGARALREIEKPALAERLALQLQSAKTINAVKTLLLRPALCIHVDDLDAAPMLLNTPAGVIHLASGTLTPHDPALMMSRMTAVAPDPAPPKRWLQFLQEATAGDAELVGYLQRLAGYALTGCTSESSVAFLYGGGGNGKSVFLNVLTAILGDYATVAPMQLFVSGNSETHPTGLAGLAGARLVTASETQEGRKWDEAQIKSITGGDPIKARFMRQDFFTYTPRFTLLFSGNHAPQLGTVDAAISRRVHIVPFTQRPKVVDTELADKLRAEYPSILHWALEGAKAWAKSGLQPPLAVVGATGEYLAEEDSLGRFLRERCVIGENEHVLTQPLFEEWIHWCRDCGEKAGAQWSTKRLAQQLRQRGFSAYRCSTTGLRGLSGLTLLVQDSTRERAVMDFAGAGA